MMLKMYSPSMRDKLKGRLDFIFLFLRSPFRKMIAVMTVIVIIYLYYMYQERPRWNIENIKYNGNLPVIYRDVRPDKEKYNIYLLDTSYKPSLNARTLCALESYCRVNPTAVIWMVLTAPTLDDTSSGTVKELQKTCSLKVVASDVNLTLKNTPLEKLPQKFGFWRSSILFNNLSDMLRLAIVYKSGGFYSDSDVLATQSVETRKNFVPFTGSNIGNAAFHFEPEHSYPEEVMTYIRDNFYRDAFGYSGPVPFSNVIKKRCSNAAKNVNAGKHQWLSYFIPTLWKSYACSKKGDLESGRPTVEFYCEDLSVLEPSSFFGYNWQDWSKMFTENPEAVCLDNLKRHSLGIHLFNKMSKGSHASPGSALHALSAASCPMMFEKTSGNVY